MKLKGKKIAFGLTSALYTFKRTIAEMKKIVFEGGEVIPIMPINTYNNTKYNIEFDFINDIENITGRKIITCDKEAEEVEADILIIAPFDEEHIAKFATFIYDTVILNVIKSFFIKNNPILIGIVSKDGLSINAENIGKLLYRKNTYFIPFTQDNPITKPTSLCFSPKYIVRSLEDALENIQIQPLLL